MNDEKKKSGNIIIVDNSLIQKKIQFIRNKQVMIDNDIADLFDVKTKRLNEQVKRNINRFPQEFCFQLTDIEKNELVANCDRFKKLKHSSSNPYAFTEQGVAMLSAVLRSETAVKMSIQIMKAFVNMRHFLIENAQIFSRIERVEQKQIETDSKLEQIFSAIESKEIKPKQGIFFEGQIFDAYKLLTDIVKSAENSIYIIDNFIDETILTLLTKRKPKVDVKIFTKNITKQMQLDVNKYNKQYPKAELLQLDKAHDRFIVIDKKDVYHLGASLKDLGKKWFAFTKIKNDSISLIEQLERIKSD